MSNKFGMSYNIWVIFFFLDFLFHFNKKSHSLLSSLSFRLVVPLLSLPLLIIHSHSPSSLHYTLRRG